MVSDEVTAYTAGKNRKERYMSDRGLTCLKCRAEGEYTFDVLEIQTLHVREMGGERKIQSLGLRQTYSICRNCAAEHLKKVMDVRSMALPVILKFGLFFIAGLILTGLTWNQDLPLRIPGFAAILTGAAGMVEGCRRLMNKANEYKPLSEEERIHLAAWDLLLETAPRKTEEGSDLTYIPIDEKTLKYKNGDLMILYDLLPDIAVRAHKLIHGQPLD